jgi:hypothetical protein
MMRNTSLLSLVVLFLSSAIFALADAAEDPESLERTREVFRNQLEAAKAAGVVYGRSEQTMAPALRDVEVGTEPRLLSTLAVECLTVDQLRREERLLEKEPSVVLERLRGAVLSQDGEAKGDADLALARAYLVLGFAEEARAIAISRQGAMAASIAALALLAEGRPEEAVQITRERNACGLVRRFIDEVGAVLSLRASNLSAEVQDYFLGLPKNLRRPIAEAITAQALANGEEPAVSFSDAQMEETAIQSDAAAFIEAAVTTKKDLSAEKLSAIGGTPGQFRLAALQRLSSQLDDDAPPEIVQAFEADAEEAFEGAIGGEQKARFSLTVAKRRASHDNLRGAAKAIASAYSHKSTREDAVRLHSALIIPRLRSSSPDDRLLALAAIVEEPQLAAASLPSEELKSAASTAARLGAVKATSEILQRSKIPKEEIDLLRGEAAYRAGDYPAAISLFEPLSSNPRSLEVLRTISILSPQSPIDRRFLTGGGGADAAEYFWHAGDFASLRTLASKSSLGAPEARLAALAYLPLKEAPQPAALKLVADERMTHLFAAAPNNVSDTGSLARFSESITESIGYLREAFENE